MINICKGDLLSADVDALVNTVNCVGVMGRGVALQFKEAFPLNYRAYKSACMKHQVEPGRMFVFETGSMTNPKYIINFPTKRHWRGKSRIEDIDSGLVALVEEIQHRGIESVAIPPLGAGLGGLNWSDVMPRIRAAFTNLPNVRTLIFEPNSDLVQINPSRDVPTMTPGRAALVGLMHRYLGGLLDPFVTLLEVHKLLYFLQEAGQPLKLRYTKALYGPYAHNVRHVLLALEGHLLAGYADGGDTPGKQLTLLPGAIKDAEAFLAGDTTTYERFQRVADLVNGFETPFGLELLSTVHWVATREGAKSLEEAIDKTYAWNEHKKLFSARQIGVALEALTEHAWL